MAISTLFRSGLFLLVALLVAIPTKATQYLPMTLAEGVDRADLVVVATVKRDDKAEGGGSLIVERVLKGPADTKRVGMTYLAAKMDPPLADGSRGVFMVTRNRTTSAWHFFHPVSIQLADDPAGLAQAVERAQQMLDNPAPFLHEIDAGKPLSADLCYATGRQLRALRVSSPQAEELNAEVLSYVPEYAILPGIAWSVRDRLTVRVAYDQRAEAPVRVTSEQADSPLLPAFSRRLRVASQWSYIKPMLRDQMQITIDTRPPTRVGDMDADQARQVLRNMIGPDMAYEQAREVMRALAWARDLEAIEPITKLLDADEEYLAQMAAQWLGQTGSTKASGALIAYLEHAERSSKEYDPVVAAASKSLYEIGDPAAMPMFQKLARHNIGYGAYALGRYGGKDDFELLLEVGNAVPKGSSDVQSALFWLVKRSNQPIEDWMVSSTWTSEIGARKQPMWRAWWLEHREAFQIERSYEQAFGE